MDNSGFNPSETVAEVVKIIKNKQTKMEVNSCETKEKTVYMKLHRFLAPFLRFVMRLNPQGIENIPEDGGILFCSNHIGALDVIAIAACTNRQISFVAKKELFSIPLLGKLITVLGAIKIDRSGNDVGAIKASISAAENGGAVAIFPQGHRYPGINPATTPKRNGAALIAYRSGCDVIPVCIQMKNGKYGLFRKIDVVFGEKIENSKFDFKNGGRDEYDKATELMFDKVVALSKYSDLPSYDPNKDKHNNQTKKKR